MIFRITFKDPDGIYETCEAVITENLTDIGLDELEIEAVADIRHKKLGDFLAKWVRHGEDITIEFDTTEGTAIVVEQ